MKAVIFARIAEQDLSDVKEPAQDQIDKLRKYCAENNIEIIKEIYGRVNLAEIDFSEQTVILGVDLDFERDFKYVDEDTLKYLLPKEEQKNNILFCGLSWSYQLFSNGYPQQHQYKAHFIMHILENALAQESKILECKFLQIINSDAEESFDFGVELAKKANQDWSIELIYGFSLLEKLVKRKLSNSTKTGIKLYDELMQNQSFKKYLENHKKLSGSDDYYFALRNMERGKGDNYRNIMAHDLFIKCLTMKESNSTKNQVEYGMWQFFSHKFWSDIKNIRNLYQFIQKWNP